VLTATARRPDAAIRDAVVAAATERYGRRLRAIVLTGSLARGEGTFREEGTKTRLLGDAELFLVFHDDVRVPSEQETGALAAAVSARVAHEVACTVSLSPVGPTYLRRLAPHIFAYELRTCGEVLWGDLEVLDLVPAFAPAAIPLEDAWRLVANRMVEYLDVAGELGAPRLRDGTPAHYKTVKLYLDLATSLLLFAGAYAPTYRERAARLARLASGGGRPDLPAGLDELAERVEECTRIKLGHAADAGPGDLDWREAIVATRQVWRWELARLTGSDPSATADDGVTDEALLGRWLGQQPVAHRLRGWLSAGRRLGWRQAAARWAAARRRGCIASPRYCVYAAASALFFRLPELCQTPALAVRADLECGVARRWLPVWPARHAAETPAWRAAAAATSWNYRVLLESTRA
jgi:hypothetical protein